MRPRGATRSATARAPLFVGGVEGIGISGTGTFTQNSGTNAIVGGGNTGSIIGNGDVSYNNQTGALLLGWYAGPQGKSTQGYVKSTKTYSLSTPYLGQAMGTYNLNGGLLTGGTTGWNGTNESGFEVVGCGGTGIFNQSGGTNIASETLCVGGCGNYGQGIFVNPYSTAAYGTYSLSNGLLSTPSLTVGAAGTGIFTQTGGINQAGVVTLGGVNLPVSGAAVSTPGTYNLYGGLLQSGYMNLDWNSTAPTTFNFTGGTLQAASGGLMIALPITVGTDASNVATLDAAGQTVQVNFNAYPSQGLLSGPGHVQVIDSVGGGLVQMGGFDLSNNPVGNNYTGGTSVLSGTLQMMCGNALPTTGLDFGRARGARAVLDLNGQQITTEGLVTASSLVKPTLNFADPTAYTTSGGTAGDLLTLGDLGMNLAAQKLALTFGVNPTVLGDYELMTGNISGFNPADFVLPTAPAGDTYSLQVVSGNVDLVVAAVPEPGTLALLGAGLMSLLGIAWRRRKAV